MPTRGEGSDLFRINPAALRLMHEALFGPRPYHVVSAEMGKLLDHPPVEGKPYREEK